MVKLRPHCGEALLRSYKVNTSSDAPPILATRSLRGPQMTAVHVTVGLDQLGMTERLPTEDTFLVGVSTSGVSDHGVLSKGKPLTHGGFAANSTRIYQLSDELQIDLRQPYEIVDFTVPRATLGDYASEDDRRRVQNLACDYDTADPTMAALARALLPYFDRPQEASAFFIDSVGLAVVAHLINRYGDAGLTSVARGGLSAVQVIRVKEMLAANLKGDLLNTDLAREIGVSEPHLIREFRRTTGYTPHQWLQWKRIDYAKVMLRTSGLPIDIIALLCGFADRRHLSRIFSHREQATPAAWREQNQS